MTPRRIYLIRHIGKPVGLVRAASPSQALRHYIADLYSATVASQDELVEHLPDFEIGDAGRGSEPEIDSDPVGASVQADDGSGA